MATRKEFRSQWLDYVVDGQPIRDWCRRIKCRTDEARCTYCKVVVRLTANGLCALKRHALSNKHRKNKTAVHCHSKKKTDCSSKHFKPKETIDTLAVLYPGMNFNCSVDLLPLRALYKASKQMRGSNLVSLLRHLVKSGAKNSFIDVYICFFCGEEFVSRPTLQSHQRECGMEPPELQPVRSRGQAAAHHHQDSIAASHLSSFLCHTTRQEVPLTLTIRKEQKSTYPYVLPSKDSFISALGLLPKKKAVQVCNRRRNTECEIIDLNEDIPVSPTLPRTPKLLISHLSRDGSDNYGDISSPNKVKRSLFSVQHSRTDKEANGRLGNIEGNSKEESQCEEKPKMPRAKSLYNLDLTSPLGQFVIKHIKGDPNLHVLSDVESHCLTCTPKKNAPTIQLRERHITYLVTFKGLLGKFSSSYAHEYKFTRRQKVEFLCRVNTGLDKESRVLLRRMKPCHVRLTHITKADLKLWMVSKNEVTIDLKPLSAGEITYWTSPKKIVDANSNKLATFPSGLTFSSPNVNNVLGLKTCQDAAFCRRYNLSVANYVSEEMFAEVTANRRAVYKSLLSDSAAGDVNVTDTDNSAADVPALSQMLSSPCLHTILPRHVQSLSDRTSLNADISKKNTLSLCSSLPDCQSSLLSFSNCHLDNSNKEGIERYNFLTYVNRNIDSLKNTFINSYSSRSNKPSNLLGSPGIDVSTENKTGQPSVGPVRSGIYSVQIRTALEGEMITGSVTDLQTVSSSDNNLIRGDNREMRRTRHRKLAERQSVIHRSFDMSKQAKTPETLRTDRLKNSDIFKSKRRKVDTEWSVGEVAQRTVIVNSRHKGQDVSPLKFLDSRRQNLTVTIKVTRATKAVKDTVSEKQESTLQVGSSQIRPVCSTFAEGIDQQKRGQLSKSVGFYRNLAAVGSFRKSVENVRKHLHKPTNTHSHRAIHSEGQQEELKVAVDKNHVCTQKLNTASDEGAEKNAVNYSSLKTKTPYISHVQNTEEAHDTRTIGNKSNISCAINNSSEKPIKKGDDTLLQTNSLTYSRYVSQDDNSKLYSPTGLRFITYSSPVSPQLRQSSLINKISILKKAEERKSLLSSFLLKSNGKSLNTTLIKESLTKSSTTEQTKSAR